MSLSPWIVLYFFTVLGWAVWLWCVSSKDRNAAVSPHVCSCKGDVVEDPIRERFLVVTDGGYYFGTVDVDGREDVIMPLEAPGPGDCAVVFPEGWLGKPFTTVYRVKVLVEGGVEGDPF